MFVTPLVKEAILPTTPVEKAVTVLTTDAAALAPGSLGSVIVVDLPPDGMEDVFDPEETVPAVRPMAGSVRHHHMGIKTGPGPNTRRVRWS